MQGVVKLLKATADLNDWSVETGHALPVNAEAIAMAETAGMVVELETGAIVMHTDDEVQTLDDQSWLAGLEAACNGDVHIAWAMTPEAYFAQAEAENRA